MSIQAVSFDAAGTLVHVAWDPADTAIRSAESLGLTVPDRQVAHEIYMRMLASRREQFCQLNLLRSREVCDGFWRDLAGDWAQRIGLDITPDELFAEGDRLVWNSDPPVFSLYPDTRPTLEAIQKRGIPLILVSNWDVSLHRVCDTLDIRKYFECVLASLEEGIEKPDPALFRIAQETTGIDPNHILHVGDDPWADIDGARRSGWQGCLIDRDAPADPPRQISSLEQVLDLI